MMLFATIPVVARNENEKRATKKKKHHNNLLLSFRRCFGSRSVRICNNNLQFESRSTICCSRLEEEWYREA
ncbi:hypothetical protein QVD17_39409 [Tagetes erecta]|uniref:Uncharacterized protein n=1 Tax=Tagetes erecta TaxID=13708 RepID=A0AAD8JNI3_TARER|nr:hypothetical protein QVD17_39409 [Tagetes erecta]